MKALLERWAVSAALLGVAALGGGCPSSDEEDSRTDARNDGGEPLSDGGEPASDAGDPQMGTTPCAARSAGCDQPDLKQCLEDHSNPITAEVCDIFGGQFLAEGCPREGLVGACADIDSTGEPDATQYYYNGRTGIEDLKANCRFGPTWCEP